MATYTKHYCKLVCTLIKTRIETQTVQSANLVLITFIYFKTSFEAGF